MLWQSPKNFQILKANQAHVWRATLIRTEKDLADLSSLLSPQEKERAAKYMVKKAADSFIISRAVLRALLAKYLQIEPQSIVFQQNKYGKLYLDSSLLQFNISHSHGLALFIFALNAPVGIDVEFVRHDYKFTDIAKKFFSKAEVAELFSLPVSQQIQAFFNCWSRKEAFIKALGEGMFSPLDEFSVEVSVSKEGQVRLSYANDDQEGKFWTLEALDPADEYSGAFAVGLAEYTTDFYDFEGLNSFSSKKP
ncbi:MAG: hypothetical protein A2V89_02745 [Gammaproteobacteria bacterium RBG_16_37_9]|nr:MAG: hypothetical protein A2V89_02745 [Gammaproteobacteria bacterium RBG_16_37_9]